MREKESEIKMGGFMPCKLVSALSLPPQQTFVVLTLKVARDMANILLVFLSYPSLYVTFKMQLFQSQSWPIKASKMSGRWQSTMSGRFHFIVYTTVRIYSTSQKFGHTYSFQGFSIFLLFSTL